MRKNVELAAAGADFTSCPTSSTQHSTNYVELHITEGAGLLSSPPPLGEQPRSERNAPARVRARNAEHSN